MTRRSKKEIENSKIPENQEVIETSEDDGLDKELEKLEKKAADGGFKDLLEQIETEYTLAWWYIKPKFDEWGLRLKLYNNQKRDKEAVGDPLLFTVQQTVLASLYGDKLSASFLARESGDEEVAENLEMLAEFDYDEMGKDELDYDWDWDTLFFGRGMMMLNEFDRKMMLPIPEVIDPMTFLRDPRARSVNGDLKGRGALRFFGRETRMTKYEMDKAGVYFNYGKLKNDSSDLRSFIDESIRLRSEAQGHNNVDQYKNLKGDNADFRLLEWFTHWKGKRVMVTLASDRKQIVRYQELKSDKWSLIDRALFPTARDWDGVSIPDLVEDKQRARAVLQNLALKGAKANVHPMYLYDSTKIKNRADLNFGFNKFVPVDGQVGGAIQVMPKDVVKQEVSFIMDLLDNNAQKATATPDIQQGQITGDKRTATELNLVSQKVDTRYSLAAKIFGWSEKRFWKQWYSLYKGHFKSGIDEKVVRLSGALGAQWRPLMRDNIIANTDPDIKVDSKVLSEARRFNDLQVFRGYYGAIAQDPNANLRYAEKHLGKLSGLKKDQINQILPPTIEELRAEDENKRIENNELVEVLPTDDNIIHIEIHNRLADNPAKFAHINAHKRSMMIQRVKPELFANLPPSAANPTAGQGVEMTTMSKPAPEVSAK